MQTDMVAPGLERIVRPDAVLQVIATKTVTGEGPVWNAREGYLLWVDIVGDTIWQWKPGVGTSVFLRPSGRANGMTYDRQGRLVVAGWASRTIWRMEPDGSIVTLASHYQGKKINTPNDLVVKSDGAIYWTDSAGALFNTGMAGPGDDLQQYLDFRAVFRLSPDGSTVTPVIEDCPGPNGIAFSPDESVLYIVDSRRRHIRAFDVQPDGTVRNPRVLYEFKGTEDKAPDGIKVDREGNMYAAGPGGVHVVDPRGNLLGRLVTPELVTNMGWGDADWRTLYVTGRRSVYRVRLGIAGVPV